MRAGEIPRNFAALPVSFPKREGVFRLDCHWEFRLTFRFLGLATSLAAGDLLLDTEADERKGLSLTLRGDVMVPAGILPLGFVPLPSNLSM